MRRRAFIVLFGSAAAARPFRAYAQQAKMRTIGFISPRSAEDSADSLAGFMRDLREGELVGGRDVVIDYQWARGVGACRRPEGRRHSASEVIE